MLTSIKKIFHDVATHARAHKSQTATIAAAGALLASSALSTPLMTATAAALGIAAVCLAMLVPAGHAVVDNALALGTKFKINPLTLGIAIGGLNTIPELAVSLGAIANGAADLGISHIVGTNIVHTLGILGMTAAVAGNFRSKTLSWKFNTLALAGATAAFGAQLFSATLSPVIGAAMLGMAGYYLYNRFVSDKSESHPEHEHGHGHGHEDEHAHDHHGHGGGCCHHGDADAATSSTPRWLNGAWAAASLTALLVASHYLVQATGLFTTGQATLLGSLFAAAVTAAPEFSINWSAALKKQTDMAVGNVMGCNLTSTLIAGGTASLLAAPVPETVGAQSALGLLNTGTFLGSAALMTLALLANRGGLKRWHGYAALGLYGAYAAGTLALGGSAPSP